MLDPQKPLHIYLGRFLFHLPHNQRRWRHYMGVYLPILQPAFEHNEAARLLVLKALDQIGRKNRKGTVSIIRKLIPVAHEGHGTPVERALCGFLGGLLEMNTGDLDKAARRFRGANVHNHRFFLPYLLAAENDVNSKTHYSRAAINFQTAIDCIYEFPPLNDITRHYLCMAHAGLCFCHVLMHQYDEAKADILHAEQMESENHVTLHARAYLHAALRQTQEARACVEKFGAYAQDKHAQLSERIERILADQDPHFTQLPIGSPEGIAAFWQNFLDHEEEMMRLLNLDRHTDASELMVVPLREMDPYHEYTYGVVVRLADGQFTLSFWCKYSRTYTAFVQEILAACPDAVRKHWRIVCDP